MHATFYLTFPSFEGERCFEVVPGMYAIFHKPRVITASFDDIQYLETLFLVTFVIS